MTHNLPDHLARRIRTAAALILDFTKEVPLAPPTVFGVVASVGTGSPEADFADNAILLGFLAGELNGLATGLEVPLPLLLVAAGIAVEVAADEESITNARVMATGHSQTNEEP